MTEPLPATAADTTANSREPDSPWPAWALIAGALLVMTGGRKRSVLGAAGALAACTALMSRRSQLAAAARSKSAYQAHLNAVKARLASQALARARDAQLTGSDEGQRLKPSSLQTV